MPGVQIPLPFVEFVNGPLRVDGEEVPTLPIDASQTHENPSEDTHHAAFVGLLSDTTEVDPDAANRIELEAGSGITLTPSAGKIAIAASAGVGTLDTVREQDGSPSVSSPTVLEFNQAAGFSVSNPSAGVARVDFSGGATGGATVLRKSSDETITSDDSETLDTDLQFSVDDNGIYEVYGVLVYNSAAAADFSWFISKPTDWSIAGQRTFVNLSGTTEIAVITSAAMTAQGNAAELAIHFHGILFDNGGSGGTAGIAWAQNTSNGGNTILRKNSFIAYRKLN